MNKFVGLIFLLLIFCLHGLITNKIHDVNVFEPSVTEQANELNDGVSVSYFSWFHKNNSEAVLLEVVESTISVFKDRLGRVKKEFWLNFLFYKRKSELVNLSNLISFRQKKTDIIYPFHYFF